MLAIPRFSDIWATFLLSNFQFLQFKTSNSGGNRMKQRTIPTSHIRFSEEEYLRLEKDKLATGKSIPWLLKTAYFKKEILPPPLDPETRKAVRRELSAIGNNLNQLTRYVHSGIYSDLKGELQECLQAIKTLKSFLGQEYGDR
jgi:hypothetical protein